MKTVNILLDTLLGDMLHTLTLSKYLYMQDGTKSNFFHLERAGHAYAVPFEQFHDELRRFLGYQEYFNSFKKFDAATDSFDYNIHHWVYGPYVYKDAFPDIMIKTFVGENYSLPHNLQVIKVPANEMYSKALIINRKFLQSPELSPFAEKVYIDIISQFEEKYFIFNQESQYENFKLKHLVEPLYVPDLVDMMSVIQGCKLFVGNQTGPLAIASTMNVNRVGELWHQSMFKDENHYAMDASRYDNAEFFDNVSYITNKQIYLK
jgi:hypothetical protein